MTNCTKYVVIDLDKLLMFEMPNNIQDWLNTLYEENRYELVAVRGNEFIFKQGSYIVSINEMKNAQDFFEG